MLLLAAASASARTNTSAPVVCEELEKKLPPELRGLIGLECPSGLVCVSIEQTCDNWWLEGGYCKLPGAEVCGCQNVPRACSGKGCCQEKYHTCDELANKTGLPAMDLTCPEGYLCANELCDGVTQCYPSDGTWCGCDKKGYCRGKDCCKKLERGFVTWFSLSLFFSLFFTAWLAMSSIAFGYIIMASLKLESVIDRRDPVGRLFVALAYRILTARNRAELEAINLLALIKKVCGLTTGMFAFLIFFFVVCMPVYEEGGDVWIGANICSTLTALVPLSLVYLTVVYRQSCNALIGANASYESFSQVEIA